MSFKCSYCLKTIIACEYCNICLLDNQIKSSAYCLDCLEKHTDFHLSQMSNLVQDNRKYIRDIKDIANSNIGNYAGLF